MSVVKKSDKTSKTQVKFVLRQAEDFAAASVGGVLCGLKEDPERPNRLYREYVQLMLGLEVHYLFPNLKRGDRKVLVDLLGARNRLVVRQRGGTGMGGSRRQAVRPGPSDVWQRKYRRLRAQAKALGRSKALTPLQRGVIEQLVLPNI